MKMKATYLFILMGCFSIWVLAFSVTKWQVEFEGRNTFSKEGPTTLEHHERKIHSEGCEVDPVMTNEEIVAEVKYCESMGMRAEAFHCGEKVFLTIYVQCTPK